MEYSPPSASATNRIRSFMGSVSVQGMFTSRLTPFAVLPMFPVDSVTYVPCLYRLGCSLRLLTANVGRPGEQCARLSDSAVVGVWEVTPRGEGDEGETVARRR